MASTIKQRHGLTSMPPADPVTAQTAVEDEHPAGAVKHGGLAQLIRLILFVVYFLGCCFTIVITQILGSPLYWINRDWYYAYMALTKQSFGLLATTMTQWWSPTVIRISGDDSVKGQFKKTPDGRVEFSFPDRIVLTANHQLYTEWLYLWWVGYANDPQMHGHLYIILKESLKYIPVIGQGMMFYGFIFMSRKWVNDKLRLSYRINKLKARHSGPMSGSAGLDPMWLLIFPEGTNLSRNTREKSAEWAKKQGVPDMKHTLLPRSTGTFFCLNELKGTLDWVYDCTLAYEGVPRGGYGAEYFGLRSTYFQGRPPKSVNMYWRRFSMSSIPLDDADEFDVWMRERWQEKDAVLEQYISTGRFPPSKDLEFNDSDKLLSRSASGFIETEVKPKHWWEVFHIFSVLAAFGLVANILVKVFNVVIYGSALGYKSI